MKRRKHERREAFLLRAHDTQGLRLFGLKKWNSANIGWASSDDFICSKVYGAKLLGDKSTQVQSFQTTLSDNGNSVTHTLNFI